MILGGGQCQKCKCIPCDPCEQECTEPHTDDPFEVVYTLYSLGAEIGNPSDGYLTASGSRDEDDPYDGMDGNSPWHQQIVGGFSFGPSVTRHPCTVRVSFWRSTRTLGPATFPPPSSTLTVSRVTLTCTAGKVRFGEYLISEGESQDFDVSFPLVAGTGDQSEDDPRSSVGTFSVTPVCRDASFSITARIEWTTSNRLHTLYGIVRECYEIGTPCAEFCDGDPAPDELYLTISNYSGIEPDSPYVVEGTYVLPRSPGVCNVYRDDWPTEGGCLFYVFDNYVRVDPGELQMIHATRSDGECVAILLTATVGLDKYCPADLPVSGTNGVAYRAIYTGANYTTTQVGSFDWEITT